MCIALKTDFLDYYDHQFSGPLTTPRHTLHRMSSGSLPRDEMFPLLKKHGFTIPKCGLVKDIVPEMVKDYCNCSHERLVELLEVVVYIDLLAHRGEGKLKLSLKDALSKYPDNFASEYLQPTRNGLGLTYRLLRIGFKTVILEYFSNNDWRSNCGEVDIEVLDVRDRLKTNIPAFLGEHPLLAVDLVAIGQKLFAIDINTAPGLRGTGLEKIMTSKEIYQEIEAYIQEKEAR
jgi:hypothetical protein